MKKTKRTVNLTLPLDATLRYQPDNGSFQIEDYPNLVLFETDGCEVFSISGGSLSLRTFLSILRKRSVLTERSRRPPFRPETKIVPVTIRIRILKLSIDNSIIGLQLLEHAQPG